MDLVLLSSMVHERLRGWIGLGARWRGRGKSEGRQCVINKYLTIYVLHARKLKSCAAAWSVAIHLLAFFMFNLVYRDDALCLGRFCNPVVHRPVVYERYLALRLQIVHDSSLLMLLGALSLRYVYMRRISPVGRANPGYK